jgi:hypothetical protein
MLSDRQRGVLGGMMAGLFATLSVLTLAITLPPRALLPEAGAASALVHALKWDVLLVAWLAANIGLLARHRFFTPEDIDGSGLTKGTPRAQVLQSILQNTLEQSVLALATHAIWAAVMPPAWQAAVPAAAMLFFVGRLLFWRGYARGAPSRALGFALTFYPTIAMLLMIMANLVRSAFPA